MLRRYDDITDKLGAPQWWDDNGCPRYCEFAPDQCGVYDTIVAFIEIGCQDCDERFRVAVTFDRLSWFRTEESRERHGHDIYPTADEINAFHFGDPPPHGCIGDTMNCDTYRVIEFWQKVDFLDWERKPEYEIAYAQGQPWNQAHEEAQSADARFTPSAEGKADGSADPSSSSSKI